MALITPDARDELIALYVSMFNAAPTGSALSEMVAAAEAGSTLSQIGATLAAKAEFQTVYPGFLTGQEFADRLVLNMLTDAVPAAAKTWATNWVLTALQSGKTRAQVIVEAVQAIRATPNANYQDAKAELSNKVDVAEYYATVSGLTGTLAERTNLLANVSSSATSDDTAINAIKEQIQTFSLTAGSSSVNEGSSATFTLSTTNVDAGTKVAYTLTGVSAADVTGGALTGTATVGSDGKATISVALAADATTEGAETLAVALDNGKASSSVVVSDTSMNTAPAFAAATAAATVVENSTAAVTGLTAATDANSDAITYSISGGADAAKFDISSSTGALSFKSGANFEVPGSAAGTNDYAVTITATDSKGAAASQAVTVSVTNVNEGPSVTSSATATAIAENGAAGAAVYTATATDPEGTTATFSLAGTDASAFSINSTTGVVSITAAADFEAKSSYSFDVVTSDGSLTNSKTVTLAVTNVNEAPSISSSGTATAVAENGTAGAVVYTATATDPEATAVTYSLGGTDAAAFSINSTTGAVSINAAANFEAKSSYSFDVTASDGTLSSSKTVALAVTDVADAPVGAADSASTPDNTPITISVLANDTKAVTVGSVTNGSNGTVVNNGTTVTYTPNSSFLNGTDTFTYIGKDADGQSSAATTVTVTINTVNTAPVITAGQTFKVTENVNTSGLSVGFVASTDEEGGTAQNWTITGGNTAGNFAINKFTGEITQSSTANFDFETTPSYTLTVTAADGAGLTAAAQTVAISVTDANDIAPVVSSGSAASVAENTAIATAAYQVTTTDSDATNGTTTYTLGGADAALFAVSATGAVTFIASPNFEIPTDAGADNVYDITVTAKDGVNSSAAKAVAITVTNVNDVTPAFTSGTTASYAENTVITTAAYTAVATDGDAGTAIPRVYSISGTDAALFDINSSTGALTFKSSPNFEVPTDAGANNVYDVTVSASDGVNTATQALAVTVTNVNEAPTAVADSATASTGQTITIDVAANDTDVDASTTLTPVIDVGSLTKGGSAQVSGTKITYTSTIGFSGTETFTYKVSDGALTSSSATVTVTVAANTGGTSSADALYGTTAAEAIDGLAGNDTIIGGGGLDTIAGGDGDDRVTFSDAAAQINGGAGNDTLVVNSDAVAQAFDLSHTSQQNLDSASKNSQSNKGTLRAFENIDATNSANSINLNGQNAVLTKTTTNNTTLGGDNTLTTSVTGSSSGDSLFFTQATGTVTVSSLAGDDIIIVDGGAIGANAHTSAAGATATGKFNIDAGAGNDYVDIRDTTAVQTIDGGDGNDTIIMGTGVSSIGGGAGNDTITGLAAAGTAATTPVTITGGDGNDTITVGSGGFNSVDGGAGNDSITSGNGTTDTVNGGTGEDSITGSTGADKVDGGDGNDTIVSNAGDDSLVGGEGNDTFSTAGNLTAADTITGGNGSDTVGVTGAGNITLATFTKVTGVEQWDITGASNTAIAVTAGDYSGLTNITLNENDTTAKANSITGITAGATVTLVSNQDNKTIGATTIALTTATGTTDSLTVNLTGAVASTTAGNVVDSLVTTGFESLTINSNSAGAALTTALGNQNIVSAIDDTALTTLTLTGASALTISALSNTAASATVAAGSMTGALSFTTGFTGALSITGGSANDTFAFGTTLLNTDSVDGGAGTGDVLTATVTSATATTGALTIKNVEKINLTEAGTSTVDATNISGGSLNFAGGSTALTITKLAAGQAIGLGFAGTATAHTGGTVTPSLADATGTADSLTINLQSTGTTAATIVTTGIETVTLAAAAEVVDTGAVVITGVTAATVALTGTLTAPTKIIDLNDAALSTTTTTFDASAFTGAVTVLASATGTAIKIKTNLAGDNISGGAGNDTITYTTFGAVAEAIAGGAGTNDSLVISSLTAALDASNIATIENYTITLGAAQTTGTAGGLITADALTQTWSGAFALTSSQATHTNLTKLDTSGVSGVVTLTSTTADTGADSTVTITGGSGTSDVLSVLYTTAATYAPVISAFETVKIGSQTDDNSSAQTEVYNLTSVTGATTVAFATGTGAVNTVNVTGYNGTTSLALGFTAAGGGGTIFQGGTTAAFGITLTSATGTADTASVTLVDTNNAADTVTITAAGVETFNINAGGSASAEDHKLNLAAVAATSGSALTINVTNGVTNAAGAGTILTISNTDSSNSVINASTFIGDLVMSARGSSSAMTITGGTGADTIIMRAAGDVLTGGTQTTGTAATNGDTLSLSFSSLVATVVDLSATDQLVSIGASANAAAQGGFENVNGVNYLLSGLEITGSSVANVIVGSSQADLVNGGAGNDTITGGVGRDDLSGGTGNDTMVFGAGVTDTVAAAASSAGVDLVKDLVLNAALSDLIDLTVTVATVHTAVSGSISEASFVANLNALLNVAGGAGFDTATAAGISAAIVTANAGTNNGKVYLAVDLDGSDTFTAADFIIEITGSTVTSLTTATFV